MLDWLARALFWTSALAVTLPQLDWDSLFSSLSIYVDDVYANEYTCTGNSSGTKHFLVFDIPLANLGDADIQLTELPQFNLSLWNSSGLLAENSFQLAYLRDEFCPSTQPGFDNIFYKGLSAGCNVTVPKEFRCRWLEISQLVNHSGPLELSILYNGEARNYTFELDELEQHYRDAEFSWLAFSLLMAGSLAIVLIP
jgi:hypothetical protein